MRIRTLHATAFLALASCAFVAAPASIGAASVNTAAAKTGAAKTTINPQSWSHITATAVNADTAPKKKVAFGSNKTVLQQLKAASAMDAFAGKHQYCANGTADPLSDQGKAWVANAAAGSHYATFAIPISKQVGSESAQV